LGGTRGRYHQWDLRNTADLRQFVPCIKDGRRKAIVESVITAFEGAKAELDGSLIRGAIHGDFNDANLILNDGGEMGLIDFGDVVSSWTVNEIAIGAAYATVSSHGQVRWMKGSLAHLWLPNPMLCWVKVRCRIACRTLHLALALCTCTCTCTCTLHLHLHLHLALSLALCTCTCTYILALARALALALALALTLALTLALALALTRALARLPHSRACTCTRRLTLWARRLRS
jgi:hypothetical protein